MPNNKNTNTVETLKQKLSEAKSVVLTDYLGLSAGEAAELRQTIKDSEGEMMVTKNTLLKVAAKEQKIEGLEEDLEGPTAVIFGFSDPIATIKAVFEFAKDKEFPKIKSAIIEGVYNTKEQVEKIKDIPSREQLIAQFIGSLKSPLSGFANVTGGVQRKFVYAIKAIADKNTEGGVE